MSRRLMDKAIATAAAIWYLSPRRQFALNPTATLQGRVTDASIADNESSAARLYIRSFGGKPAGAHDIRKRQHTGDDSGRRKLARRHERAVGKRHTQERSLCVDNVLLVLAGRLIPGTTADRCCRRRRTNRSRIGRA